MNAQHPPSAHDQKRDDMTSTAPQPAAQQGHRRLPATELRTLFGESLVTVRERSQDHPDSSEVGSMTAIEADHDHKLVSDLIDKHWIAAESPEQEATGFVLALYEAIADVHNRYEQLAKWADQQADSREPFAKVDPSYRMTLIPYRAMAERIRMVAGQAPEAVEAPPRYQNNPATWPNGVRLGCDVCGLPSTWTSTPGGIRFCDDHGDQR